MCVDCAACSCHLPLQTPVLHDLSTEWFNVGVVYANGKGSDLNMDHHRWAALRVLYEAGE